MLARPRFHDWYEEFARHVAHAYAIDMEITDEAVTWSTSIVVAAALVSLLF